MIETERLFAGPAFEGLRVIRRALAQSPGSPLQEIVAAIRLTEADATSLLLEEACSLHELVDACEVEDGPSFYRHCIRGVLLRRLPIWVKTMKLGRQVFIQKLDPDAQQLFRDAGLLAAPAPPDVVEWWDTIGHEVKLETDLEKMAQARTAERLSLDSEKQRLLALGIDSDPLWVGLDDNTAGYDILSYEPGKPEKTNKLIEVKSTVASPLRFFVTRNEWAQAQKSREAYVFHIWDMSKRPPVLYVRTVAQIEAHIPSDNEKGKWSNAEIPLSDT